MVVRIALADSLENAKSPLTRALRAELEAQGVRAELFCFQTAEKLLRFFRDKGGADAVFLNVLLPDGSGVEAAREVRAMKPAAKVVFLSAVAADAADIFEASPTYFLGKPVGPEKLSLAVKAVLTALGEEREDSILLRTRGRARILPRSRIESVVSHGRKLEFRFGEETVSVYGNLEEYHRRLGPGFFRCHRSCLANLRHVQELEQGELVLFSGRRLPVSRRHRAEARQAFLAPEPRQDNQEEGGNT